jgi:hypothetical protein
MFSFKPNRVTPVKKNLEKFHYSPTPTPDSTIMGQQQKKSESHYKYTNKNNKMTNDTEKRPQDLVVETLKKTSPFNQHCADCVTKKDNTEWISVNLGIFLCIQCSGVHRSLGTHISKVRSIRLDEWNSEIIEQMEKIGNYKSNAYWECNLFPFEKPLEDDPWCYRKFFIVNKYVNKLYVPSLGEKVSDGRDDDAISHPTTTTTTREQPKSIECLKLKRKFDSSIVRHRGWISKQGLKNKAWKRRYMVLNDDCLSYYKAENATTPQGQFLFELNSNRTISSNKVVFMQESVTGKKHCFALVTEKRTYVMCCDQEDQMIAWVYALRGAVYYSYLKGIYLDPAHLERLRYDCHPSLFIYEGYMKMYSGGAFGSIKTRYLRLKNFELTIYPSEKNGEEPIETIRVKDIQDISSAASAAASPSDTKAKKEYCLTLKTHNRHYTFYWEQEQEWRTWSDLLQKCSDMLNEDLQVKRKSLEIHDIVLSKIYDLTPFLSPVRGSIVDDPFHSPYNFSMLNFHRSKALRGNAGANLLQFIQSEYYGNNKEN